MANTVVLDGETHRKLRVSDLKAWSGCADLAMVYVVLSEIPKLVAHYPLVFTKDQDSGRMVCVALLGLEANQNLYWRENRWDALRVPLEIARRPLFVGPKEDGGKLLTWIDLDNPGVGEVEGEALFDEQGQPTPYQKQKVGALVELLQSAAQTQKFIDKLVELDLIAPMRLDITFQDQQARSITSLSTVHEQKLKDLSKDAVGELHSLGFLGPLYMIMGSLGHIYGLIQRRNALK
jgi:hypothetical protein